MIKLLNKLFLILFLQLLTFACSDVDNATTYLVSKKDFEDVLSIDGIVEPVNSVMVVCPRGVYGGTVISLLEDGTYVKKGDTICVIENQEMENRYEKLLADMEKEEARLAKARANADMEYALLEAQVKSNEVSAEIAQLDSMQIIYSSQTERRIKELELKKVSIEKAQYKKKLQAQDIIQKSDIRKMELRIARLSNTINVAKLKLDELVIKSPQDGLVVRSINYDTDLKLQVGDQLWEGMPIASIPEMLNMKVKITASESDYKTININNKVQYTFDALPYSIAYGKITKKAPIGRTLKKNSKVKFFDIESSIDSVQVMPEPDFTVNCRVVLKSVKDTIVIPQIAIFEEDSLKVSYVKIKGGYERRQILTGLASPKESIIVAGLKQNEIVALSKPKSAMIKNTILLADSILKRQNIKQ